MAGRQIEDHCEIVGVDRRTLSRWKKQSGPPKRRVRMVASLVAVLRHNWTEEGIVAWFYRPRRDLDGRKPIALLDDPNEDYALIIAARSSVADRNMPARSRPRPTAITWTGIADRATS
jgi:uncharacterized protein (DUF2384 family)